MWVNKDHYYELREQKAVAEAKVAHLKKIIEGMTKSMERLREEKAAQAAAFKDEIKEQRAYAERAIDSALMSRQAVPVGEDYRPPTRKEMDEDPFEEDPSIRAAMQAELAETGGDATALFAREMRGEEIEVERVPRRGVTALFSGQQARVDGEDLIIEKTPGDEN